jgi:bifunctional ADP-heptose synthase (sugar kinase/adenylyltransferase)
MGNRIRTHLVRTRISRDSAVLDARRDSEHSTLAHHVYDVIAAGNTVTGYSATTISADVAATEVSQVAIPATRIEVAKLGAATVRPAKSSRHFAAHHPAR